MFKVLTILLCLTPFPGFSQTDREDYKIYSCLIESNLKLAGKSIAVIDSTINFTLEDFVPENEDTTDEIGKRVKWIKAYNRPFDSLGYEAAVKYYFYPTATKRLENKFQLKTKVKIISLSVFTRAMAHTNTKQASDILGADVVYQFSNVYYSNDRTRAFLQYRISDVFGKKGFGKAVVAVKVQGKWVAKFEVLTWSNLPDGG